MAYDLFFINETKKQIVGSKKLYAGFELQDQLLCYLSFCHGDTIRIVGEENELIEKEVYGHGEKNYKYIELCHLEISEDRYECPDVEKLREEVFNKKKH